VFSADYSDRYSECVQKLSKATSLASISKNLTKKKVTMFMQVDEMEVCIYVYSFVLFFLSYPVYISFLLSYRYIFLFCLLSYRYIFLSIFLCYRYISFYLSFLPVWIPSYLSFLSVCFCLSFFRTEAEVETYVFVPESNVHRGWCAWVLVATFYAVFSVLYRLSFVDRDFANTNSFEAWLPADIILDLSFLTGIYFVLSFVLTGIFLSFSLSYRYIFLSIFRSYRYIFRSIFLSYRYITFYLSILPTYNSFYLSFLPVYFFFLSFLPVYIFFLSFLPVYIFLLSFFVPVYISPRHSPAFALLRGGPPRRRGQEAGRVRPHLPQDLVCGGRLGHSARRLHPGRIHGVVGEACSTNPNPSPYTQHPTPYTPHPSTLHPTPYTPHSSTLHPTPYTLHPTPVNPTPYTPHPSTLHPTPVNPTPYTLHPTPLTLIPYPCTLHPTPYTINPQPSTLTIISTPSSLTLTLNPNP
jgi:hypothetical protein